MGQPQKRTFRTLATPQSGTTFLELAIIVSLLMIFVLVAYHNIWRYRVAAEKTGVAYTIGTLRSALGMEVARLVAGGNTAAIARLEHSNPILLLQNADTASTPPYGLRPASAPANYLGEFDAPDPDALEGGNWYFDRSRGELSYLVLFEDQFETPLEGRGRISVQLQTRYTDSNENGRFDPDTEVITGIQLNELARYRWLQTE